MAFALKKTTTVTRAVPLVQYNEDGSEVAARLNVRYKVLTRAQLDDLTNAPEDDTRLLLDVVVDGIADSVTNEAGETLSAADALALIREDLILTGQITNYYFKFLAGTVAEKNAPKSRAR